MQILFIQNVSSLLIQLEESLETINVQCRLKEREKIFSYLIAKTLFKTGRCNIVYTSLIKNDRFIQEIEKAIVYFRKNKYLSTIVLNEILIPELIREHEDYGVYLYLKGDLLFMYKN